MTRGLATYVVWIGAVGLLEPLSAQDTAKLTVRDALELAFPKCRVERTRVVLTEAQRDRVTALAGVPLRVRVARPYVAKTENGALAGTAYFDRHRVRTKDQVLMVVVTPKNRIGRIEALAFAEPREYRPREKWYRLFDGGELDAELSVRGRIKPVTGSTLTVRATTAAARRILALHQVLHGRPSSKPTSQPTSQPTRKPTSKPTRKPAGKPAGKPAKPLSEKRNR